MSTFSTLYRNVFRNKVVLPNPATVVDHSPSEARADCLKSSTPGGFAQLVSASLTRQSYDEHHFLSSSPFSLLSLFIVHKIAPPHSIHCRMLAQYSVICAASHHLYMECASGHHSLKSAMCLLPLWRQQWLSSAALKKCLYWTCSFLANFKSIFQLIMFPLGGTNLPPADVVQKAGDSNTFWTATNTLPWFGTIVRSSWASLSLLLNYWWGYCTL